MSISGRCYYVEIPNGRLSVSKHRLVTCSTGAVAPAGCDVCPSGGPVTQHSLTLTGLAQPGQKLRTCPLSKLRLAAARAPETDRWPSRHSRCTKWTRWAQNAVLRQGFFPSRGNPTKSYLNVYCDVPRGGGSSDGLVANTHVQSSSTPEQLGLWRSSFAGCILYIVH